jgi:hypothetical protein
MPFRRIETAASKPSLGMVERLADSRFPNVR